MSSFKKFNDLNEINSNRVPSLKFEKIKCIGRGGHKLIYEVFCNDTDRFLALAEPINTESHLSKQIFQREMAILGLLQHPNIVPIFSKGSYVNEQGKEVPYFTMPLLKGMNLKDYRDSGHHDNYLQIVINLCDAMVHAHSIGICHLDLNLKNIWIDSSGAMTVIDWGCARSHDRDSLGGDHGFDLNDDLIVGTEGFTAPEIFDKKDFNAASDVFSIAKILENLLSFSNINKFQRKRLTKIILKSTHVDKEIRYQSTLQLKSEILSVLNYKKLEIDELSLTSHASLYLRGNPQVSKWLRVFLYVLIILWFSWLFWSSTLNLNLSKRQLENEILDNHINFFNAKLIKDNFESVYISYFFNQEDEFHRDVNKIKQAGHQDSTFRNLLFVFLKLIDQTTEDEQKETVKSLLSLQDKAKYKNKLNDLAELYEVLFLKINRSWKLSRVERKMYNDIIFIKRVQLGMGNIAMQNNEDSDIYNNMMRRNISEANNGVYEINNDYSDHIISMSYEIKTLIIKDYSEVPILFSHPQITELVWYDTDVKKIKDSIAKLPNLKSIVVRGIEAVDVNKYLTKGYLLRNNLTLEVQ